LCSAELAVRICEVLEFVVELLLDLGELLSRKGRDINW
jgi:hypothetical protein